MQIRSTGKHVEKAGVAYFKGLPHLTSDGPGNHQAGYRMPWPIYETRRAYIPNTSHTRWERKRYNACFLLDKSREVLLGTVHDMLLQQHNELDETRTEVCLRRRRVAASYMCHLPDLVSVYFRPTHPEYTIVLHVLAHWKVIKHVCNTFCKIGI